MTSGDRVLITGASGFVGSAVARALEKRGYALRLLVRPSSPRTNLDGLACEIVPGDLMDAASVRRALKDVRYLVHVAADYRLWARDPGEIVRNNREGTRTVMQAALDEGIEKVVYTSSVATLKPGHGPVDETARANESEAIGAYKKSKVAAERVVEAMIAEHELPGVIVHPSTPIGPRDVKPTPTGRIIVETAMGRIPAFIDTGLNLVHVDDVAEGHVLALEHGKVGERYILGGENVALREMLQVIAPLAGRRAPRLKLPRGPLFPIAYAAEAAARFTGKEPFITADGLKMAKHRMFFTSLKAERELGYRARPYAEGLVDAVRWFRDAGYLR
jgi:dihydroflavonol-4-reductase